MTIRPGRGASRTLIAPLVRQSLIPKPSATAISRDQVLNELGARRGGRTLEQMAAEVGVSFQYLAKVLSGERVPGDKVLEWLGLRKVTATWYERVTIGGGDGRG